MRDEFDTRTNGEVRDAIIGLHREMCASLCALLSEIAEHDRRQAWSAFGASSEEAYLVNELGLQWSTARGWVKMAHGLDRNPDLAGTLAEGEISADKLLPIIELMDLQRPGSTDPLGPFDNPGPSDGAPAGDPSPDSDPSAEPDPSPKPVDPEPSAASNAQELANKLSAAQLAAMARRRRHRTTEEANAADRRRKFRAFDRDGGSWVHVEGDFFDDDAVAFRGALDEYLRARKPDAATGLYPDIEQGQADAVMEMVAGYLGRRERATNRPVVILHADAAVADGVDGWAETSSGVPIASETIRRMMCFCQINLQLDDKAGNPLMLGRSRRLPTWSLAEAVRRRDRGCRFPGCGHRRFTQVHHVAEWDADKGPTDYDNLCELCKRHHRLVHEGGWKMSGNPCGELTFTDPGGTISLSSWPDEASHPPGEPPPDAAQLFAAS